MRRDRRWTAALLGGALLAVAALAAASAGRSAPPPPSATAVAELGPAPRTESGFANLDPKFHRASNWLRVRFFLLGTFSVLNRETRFEPLPLASPDLAELRQNRTAATATWIGHSTVLLQLDGVNILTDPNWADRVGPFGGLVGVGRYTLPGVAFADLPPIDAVLISHDHYDHLDEPTVRRLHEQFRPLFLVPLGLKAWLADRGITNTVELDWGEAHPVKSVTVVCTPAQHGSGRTAVDQNRRLWASWAVIGSKRFYFGGDTGYASHFEAIGRALGPFDLAALPIGSYTPPAIATPVHISPEEALQAWVDLKARHLLAIHWGTFSLGREPADEPPRRLIEDAERRQVDRRALWLLKPGEVARW